MKKKLITVGICIVLVLIIVAALIIIPKTSLADLFAKKIKIGFTDNAPYSFKNEEAGGSGFSCDLAAKIFEGLGYKVVFVNIAADEKASKLQSGEIDCYIDATVNTAENTYYSKDYIACVQGTFYKNPEIKLYSAKDLKNYKCSFVAGSSVLDYLKKNGASGIPELNAEAAAKAVNDGRADICITDNYYIADFIKNRTGYSDFNTGIYLYNERHYFAFSEKNRGLITDVNAAISKLKKDGTLKNLLNLYGLTEFAS